MPGAPNTATPEVLVVNDMPIGLAESAPRASDNRQALNPTFTVEGNTFTVEYCGYRIGDVTWGTPLGGRGWTPPVRFTVDGSTFATVRMFELPAPVAPVAGVRGILELSTGHLPLKLHDGTALSAVASFPRGWLVAVPDESDPEQHPVLRAVLTYARTNGCRYVLFDADADRVPGLTYWG